MSPRGKSSRSHGVTVRPADRPGLSGFHLLLHRKAAGAPTAIDLDVHFIHGENHPICLDGFPGDVVT